MSFDLEKLYSLLPAVYRIRDLEQGQSAFLPSSGNTTDNTAEQPLRALMQVLAEQIGILEDNLDQLYDDQFIETCTDWAIPYIGDLIGYHTPRRTPDHSQRAEVANTISYRRRKGTILLQEQLVQDVTGWNVHIVEYFKLIAATQHTNRPRPQNTLVDLRKQDTLVRLGTPFESSMHTIDLRNGSIERGRYTIAAIGIFLWRLNAYSMTDVPAFRPFEHDQRRYLFNPLGSNLHLFSLPHYEENATQLSDEQAVAMPISRTMIADQQALQRYYGRGKSFLLTSIDAQGIREDISPEHIIFSDLSDLQASDGTLTWTNLPRKKIAIDPVLGRIAFPQDAEAPNPTHVYCSFHYGFSADIGGGEYHRAPSFSQRLQSITRVFKHSQQYSIQDVLDTIAPQTNAGQGLTDAIEIGDSERYRETLTINAEDEQSIEIRAADFHCPLIVPDHGSGIPEIHISGSESSSVILNGLHISNCILRVHGRLGHLTLRHCTLVPGLTLSIENVPHHTRQPSLIVESAHTQVVIDHCIVGALHINASATVHITSSIVDATTREHVAYASPATHAHLPGGALAIENSTIIGRVSTTALELASNTLFLAHSSDADEGPPVYVARRQQGGVRFSYLLMHSLTPRRYRCQPETVEQSGEVEPQFTSLRYGDPGYCQLLQRTSPLVRQGADDGAEMGVFHDLLQPQREGNLRERLKEYLRFTMEPTIIYMQ
jgi:hypothetical protein